MGSDWKGKFDYLNEYCEVIYLERTQGISSSEIREQSKKVSLGLVGNTDFINKIARECTFINGIHTVGICTDNVYSMSEEVQRIPLITNDYNELLENVDAVYLRSQPQNHYEQIKKALNLSKHVLCESPMTLRRAECYELYKLAEEKGLILMEAIKTFYATAFSRLLLLIKGGTIGKVVSVDATCTSLRHSGIDNQQFPKKNWRGFHEWGPTALLPVFQILGTEFISRTMVVKYSDSAQSQDSFIKIDFIYQNAVASVKVGDGVKSEGELVISGTKGYVYVPAPWWKTEYFEIRFENQADNKRYFYQLDGEGIRYELVSFYRNIQKGKNFNNISTKITEKIAEIMEEFETETDLQIIQ